MIIRAIDSINQTWSNLSNGKARVASNYCLGIKLEPGSHGRHLWIYCYPRFYNNSMYVLTNYISEISKQPIADTGNRPKNRRPRFNVYHECHTIWNGFKFFFFS